jgi:SAM-dependent methyltransferase
LKRDALPAASPQPSALRDARTDAAWRAVFEAACAPYRPDWSFNSRWAWHWARGKLGRDPVFRGLLERGDLRPGARVVDIGCGQGLIACLLHACEQQAARGAWPAAWPAWHDQPSFTAYHGIELLPQDVARGNTALARFATPGRHAAIECADLRKAVIPGCDLLVILDVLHYVDHAEQVALLQRVRQALAPRGRLLLRVGDPANSHRKAFSVYLDRLVIAARGHRVPTGWTRPIPEWATLLQRLGFRSVQPVAMSQGTPFANVLLVADLIEPTP